jgi:hypothetical protein
MEYVCSDPNAQVRETFVMLIQKALSAIPSLGRHIIEAHELPTQDISPDRFIPLQRTLDMLRHVHEEMGPIVVRQIGSHTLGTIEYPPQLDSVEAVLLSLNFLYQDNHRGGAGRYEIEQQPDGSLTMRCFTPYPREFVRGLVEGICRNERLSKGQRFRIAVEEGPAGAELTSTMTLRRS